MASWKGPGAIHAEQLNNCFKTNMIRFEKPREEAKVILGWTLTVRIVKLKRFHVRIDSAYFLLIQFAEQCMLPFSSVEVP